MRALLVSDVFPPRVGGSGRWLWETYRRFPTQEFSLAVGQAVGQEQFDRQHDLTLRRLPLTLPEVGVCSRLGLQSHWSALGALWPLVATGDFDQLHAGRCLPEGWLVLLLSRWFNLPFVCHVYGEEVNLAIRGGEGGTMASGQLRWMTRTVLSGASLLVVNSRNTRRILIEQWHVPPERIRLIQPGVDTVHFAPAARDASVRAELGWSDRPVVLTVGRLQRRKGHDQMICALEMLRARVPNILYSVVGTGEEEQRLHELVRVHGLQQHVQFRPAVGDATLVRYYQQCDLFVLPNRQVGRDIEGFGLVLLEAQACGRPVIAGASGGTSDALTPETGCVVPCETPGPLAERIAELLEDSERLEQMGLAARRWTLERFAWTQISRAAYDVFASIGRQGAVSPAARQRPDKSSSTRNKPEPEYRSRPRRSQ